MSLAIEDNSLLNIGSEVVRIVVLLLKNIESLLICITCAKSLTLKHLQSTK